ncbi:MAG: hypothetical protein AAGA20_12595 [Planctomycetota bacterium]
MLLEERHGLRLTERTIRRFVHDVRGRLRAPETFVHRTHVPGETMEEDAEGGRFCVLGVESGDEVELGLRRTSTPKVRSRSTAQLRRLARAQGPPSSAGWRGSGERGTTTSRSGEASTRLFLLLSKSVH